jgi:hypothetical protein
MVQPSRWHLDAALAAAARSPLITGMAVTHPWRRLGSFIILAAVLLMVMIFVVAFAIAGIPGMRDQLGSLEPLPDGPLRLIDESLLVLMVAAILGAMALGILLAAALTYRRPIKDFLWPGRRFDARQLGSGFLAMACISILLIPIYLAMGSEWAPPVLNPLYLDHTRLTYVLAMIVGLLVAQPSIWTPTLSPSWRERFPEASGPGRHCGLAGWSSPSVPIWPTIW